MLLKFPENKPKDFRFSIGPDGKAVGEVHLDQHEDFVDRGDGQFVHFSRFVHDNVPLGLFSSIDTRPRVFANKVLTRINQMAVLDFFFVDTSISVLNEQGEPQKSPSVNVAFNIDATKATIASSVILDLPAALELYLALKAKFEPGL